MKKIFLLALSVFFLSGCAETWKHLTKLKKDNPAGETSAAEVAPVSEAASGEVAELRETISTLSQKVDELSSSINELTSSVGSKSSASREAAEADMLEPVEVDIMEAPVEKKAAVAPLPPTVVEKPKALPLKEQYEAGYNLYKKGAFSDAIESFDLLLETYPDSDYSDNASYWKGECYYSMGNFAEAIRLFQETAQKYPKGNKTPAAQLKAGFAYIKMQNKEGAKKQFQKVIDLYPFSQQAETAIKKLNAL